MTQKHRLSEKEKLYLLRQRQSAAAAVAPFEAAIRGAIGLIVEQANLALPNAEIRLSEDCSTLLIVTPEEPEPEPDYNNSDLLTAA